MNARNTPDRALITRTAAALATLLVAIGPAGARQVDVPTARDVGGRFLSTVSADRGGAPLTLAYRMAANAPTPDAGQVTYLYVFNSGAEGFVVIAGDDVVAPVLGYSTEGTFDPDNIPIALAKWLEGYRREIRAAIEEGMEAGPGIRGAWESLSRTESTGQGERDIMAVPPLVSSRWDQAPHYNALCPGGSMTGCVATAMAQIMKYWNHPATGSGFHQYNHPNYGTLAANFAATSYAWGSMPNTVSGPNNAVATLMYHCGVSVDMQYSPQVSNAYLLSNASPIQHCAEYAMRTYFGYRQSMQGMHRSSATEAQWTAMLRAELDASRPVLYAGFGDGGGHAFVCDGYDDNGFFHFNWGWGGMADGYFRVNALNPGSTGTGGGTGGYNSGQQVLIGIEPPSGGGGGPGSHDMRLFAQVLPSATTLAYGQAFSVTTNILNNGSGTFTGDYCAAVFDNANNFIDFVQVLSGYTLPPGNVYTSGLSFSTTGLFSMLPGTYRIGIYYRPTGGDWAQVANSGSYVNFPQVTVVNNNSIALNAAMTVTPSGNLVQGGQVSVNLNIINNGGPTFFGQYGVALYNLDGTWAQDIGVLNENNGLPSGYTYLSPYLTFGPATVTVPPGTYLLALQHNPNGTGWQLTGTGSFTNPIRVTVTAASLQPDPYEVNDQVAQAHTLPVNFSGNTASAGTPGSNLHVVTDLDHYKVVLPAGFDYSVTARLHDSYNSGNGNTYTADVLFAWSTDGASWSSAYDDVMPGNITVNNGGTVLFKVAPYFAGGMGTYLLQLGLTRTATTGLEETAALPSIRVFPNPATDRLVVELGGQRHGIERMVLLDADGRFVKEEGLVGRSGGPLTIDVSCLAAGAYLLQVHTARAVLMERVIIAR